jgi:hypothetical protein
MGGLPVESDKPATSSQTFWNSTDADDNRLPVIIHSTAKPLYVLADLSVMLSSQKIFEDN